jgi:hypothetical protein
MNVLAEALVLTVAAVRHYLDGHSTDFTLTMQDVTSSLRRASQAEKKAIMAAAKRLAEMERAVDGSDDNPWQLALDGCIEAMLTSTRYPDGEPRS